MPPSKTLGSLIAVITTADKPDSVLSVKYCDNVFLFVCFMLLVKYYICKVFWLSF